jgi:hypothetical protein
MSSILTKNSRTLVAVGAALALALIGCSTEPDDDGGNSGGGCERTYIITYSSLGTGDGTFDFVSYDNGFGRRIDIINPGKTWNTQIQMCQGETVAMTGNGAVSGGTLLMSVTGDDGVGNEVTLSEEIIGDGTVTTYTLTIPQQTLP